MRTQNDADLFYGWNQTATASTPRHQHACNCIGCCPRCGTCRTWPGHTRDYCDLIVSQVAQQAAFISRRACA